MKMNIAKFILTMLFMVSIPAMAQFKDIKVDLNSLLTEAEVIGTEVSFGIAVAEDGTVTRVEDGEAAVATLSGKYHNEHGWTNAKMVVAVDGPVKVGFGNCTYSYKASVITPAEGEAINVVMTQSCYKKLKSDISYGYYAGEATTLTLSGSDYCRYMSVESIALEDIPNEINVSYELGEAAGVLPATMAVEVGKTFTIPSNTTLYVEGKTLTGWTDGTTQYAIGQEITAGEEDITLTPIFTENTVSLADRTEAVTIKWQLGVKNGCTVVKWEKSADARFVVAQAAIGEATIDVKFDVDVTGGKFDNTRGDQWAQVNEGTILTLPSCKGAVVTMNAANAFGVSETTVTTIDGQSDYTSAKTVEYTITSENETIDIVMGGDARFLSDIQVVLPSLKSTAIDSVEGDVEVVATRYFNLVGSEVDSNYKGMVIKVDYLSNGAKVTTKTIK